jgi:putative transposase
MPRLARLVIPGIPHHVTQRGNNRQDVFFVDDDRRVYLALLEQHAERYGVEVLGYCLMGNHVHVIAVPPREDSLAKALGRTHFLYTQYLHRLHGRSGHLWQNRFFSCALDEPRCWTALCYMERNPVRARVVREAWRYRWSSAAAHCGAGEADGWLELGRWQGARWGWSPGGVFVELPGDSALPGRVVHEPS